MGEWRVVVVDDSVFVREGVSAVLRTGGLDVVSECADASDLPRKVSDCRADIVVMDIRMPPTHTTEGIEAALALRRAVPGQPVLLLSQYVETAHLDALIATGAAGLGYLLKDRVLESADFLAAVERVLTGGTALDPDIIEALMTSAHGRTPFDRLSAREQEVLSLMAEGLSNTAIASGMSIGTRTLESHVASIFTKLDLPPQTEVHRRVAAVVAWLGRR